MKKLSILICLFFSFIINVNAASLCNYKDQVELNQKAANIKRNYEIKGEIKEYSDGEARRDWIEISILNIPEEFYIVVTNNIDDTEKTYYYKDTTNGTVTFDWDEINKITTFSIKIYSSDKTSCPDELYKTLSLTTPKFNEFSNMSICDEAKDFSLCQEYITFNNNMNTETFLEKVYAYLEGDVDKNGEEINKNEQHNTFNVFNTILTFIVNHVWLTVIVLLLCIGGITLLILKKRKIRKIKYE